jgi:hypothetical protein
LDNRDVAVTVETPAVDQLQELEAARLATVSLLAVVSDEQFEAVEAALKALARMSDAAPAALEELYALRGSQRKEGKGQPEEAPKAIEAYLAMQHKRG